MLIGNEPAPWQYYVKQFPGVPIEQLRQRYLAEQLQHFQQVEQMYNQMAIDGASQPVEETTTTSTTTSTTTVAPYPLSICVNLSDGSPGSNYSGNILFTGLDVNGYPTYQGDLYDPYIPFTFPSTLNYDTVSFPQQWFFSTDAYGGGASVVSETTTELNPLLANYDSNPNTTFTEGPCI